jgi:Ca-activated chloride channel family protein
MQRTTGELAVRRHDKEDHMVRRTWLRLLVMVALALPFGEGRGRAQPLADKLKGETERLTLAANLGHPLVLAGRSQRTFLKIGVEGIARELGAKRAPINVAIVLDCSSSMAGDRLEKAKQAASLVVEHLTADDMVSVVAYNETVSVLIPATAASRPAELTRQIAEIEASGTTALFAGVAKGAHEVRKYVEQNRVNRVVLLSDGMANVGPSSPGELAELGQALAKQGISVTTIGLGDGYNEDLMVTLARASDGNHGYARTADDLARIFQLEFASQADVVARDVRVTVRFAAGVRPVRALGREAEIVGSVVSARVNEVYPKQERYLLLEIELPVGAAGNKSPVATVEARYVDPASRSTRTLSSAMDVGFSDSATEVGDRMNKDVMATGATLVANEANKQAVLLRDEGKTDEAVALLENNAVFLEQKARELGSDRLRKEADLNRKQKVLMPAPKWNESRKEMRKRQFQNDYMPAEL